MKSWIRRSVLEWFPSLEGIRFTHAWGWAGGHASGLDAGGASVNCVWFS
jgi:hypothetical protein